MRLSLIVYLKRRADIKMIKYLPTVCVELLLIYSILKIFIPLNDAHDLVFVIFYLFMMIVAGVFILLIHLKNNKELIINGLFILLVIPFLILFFSRHEDFICQYYFTACLFSVSLILWVFRIVTVQKIKQ